MFKKIEPRPGLVAGEHEVLRFWEETKAFEALRAKNAGGPKWSFLDGPITANNPMGVHHAWGRTYKDAFQRYYAMRGFDQRWQNGFDCQGLWVEVQVERELGFKNKKDIEKFGLERFVNACKERVLKYSAIQTDQSIRLGMWMDWDNSYFTMSDENNYTIWSFLKKCHSRDFIYKGLDSMPWCPRCGTGISEQERREGYLEVVDDSVFVRFPLKERKGESLLVWTTTPWTLAANVVAAVHPELDYVRIADGDGSSWVAAARSSVMDSAEILEQVRGEALIGWTYEGPFDELPGAADAVDVHRVISWDDVADDEGTGIVHIATGCGKEDFELGKQLGLPVIAPIDAAGNYYEGFGFLTGRNAADVSGDIYESLRAKGHFFKSEPYTHDYPHCWRCDTPLLFRAVDEWYIGMDWRDEIKEVVKKIRWVPEYGLDQELDWLTNMGDWMISKKRYWGLALPIWECAACNWFDVIGGREELKERAVTGWEEFDGNSPHRPWIDSVKIRCGDCGELASRIPEVGNPWLDAGIVPYSTVGYNTDPERWAEWIPADFVVESFPGQFRNWFYALLAMSTMMEGIEPFKNLLGHALVKDEKGEEFSKSKHMIEFNEAADRVSADVMRWAYCRATPTNNLNFGYDMLDQTSRKVFGTLWNTYLFFSNYAILDEFDPRAPKIPVDDRPEIDRWILSRLNGLIASANEYFGDYWVHPFVREAEGFIDDLSNWYVRRSRPRFWSKRGQNEHDKQSAYQTLYQSLVTFVQITAPVVPFFSERLYRTLVADLDDSAPISVHLTDYPEPDSALLDPQLDADMSLVKDIAGTAHSLRKASGHRVRQPLRVLRVAGRDIRGAIERLDTHLIDELNVKSVEIVDSLDDISTAHAAPDFSSLGPKHGKAANEIAGVIRELSEEQIRRLQRGTALTVATSGGEVQVAPEDVKVTVETSEGWAVGQISRAGRHLLLALDIKLSEELEREGVARDFVRHVQNLRKELDLNIEDRILVTFESDDEIAAAVAEWMDYVCAETQCDGLDHGDVAGGTEVAIADKPVRIEVKLASDAPLT